MAVVPITIQAIISPRDKSGDPYPATIVGFASLTGLEVGGGPIIPGLPPIGGDAHPSHPIVLPGDPSWGDPHPTHPIVIPDPPPPIELPPGITEGTPPTGGKPPPPQGGWGYVPGWGWAYFPGPTQPGPKAPAAAPKK